MTRSTTRDLWLNEFSKCTVRITKIPHLDQLLRNQRSAKIIARRNTVAIGNSTNRSAVNGPNALFRKVTNKPFTSRRINRRSSMCSTNNVSTVAVADGTPEPNTDRNVSIVHEESVDENDTVSAGPSGFGHSSNVSLIDIDDEQHDKRLSSIKTIDNPIRSNSVACILDSVVPDGLPTPLAPVFISKSTPVSVMPEPKRKVPDMIRVVVVNRNELEPKQYMPARRGRSNVAQFILDSLDKYNTTIVDNGFDSSDDDFGRLVYSDSE